MAFDWEHVEAIRAEQNSARAKRDINTLPTDETSERIYNSPTGIDAKVPKLDHWEQMIQKVRTQLIDYIISHGLVQGFEYDGIDEPIKNGKIVLTADMLKRVTNRFGYFREKETREFIEQFLPEHFYVSDENYVHTDNNYTDAEKEKLEGIADGAEVNKVISILFNGVESIDSETRIATITITPADVKAWYEQNLDTNVFTDAEKAKLESIDIDALSNKVEDVTLDGETIVKNKVAILTAKKIKDSYESNTDTNAFTDADKALVERVLPEVQKGVNQHEQRIDALEKSQTVQDTEIKDAKDSISELGDEVNSVAGRVTNLEGSQKVQDGKISALEQENTEQDGRLDALETSDTTQNADILQLKEDVKNAGKVDDVQVDGTSVVKNKIAKIPKILTEEEIDQIVNTLITQGYVPYTGAINDVDLGSHTFASKFANFEQVYGSTHIRGALVSGGAYNRTGELYTDGVGVRGLTGTSSGSSGIIAGLEGQGTEGRQYGRLFLRPRNVDNLTAFLEIQPETYNEGDSEEFRFLIQRLPPSGGTNYERYLARVLVGEPTKDSHATTKKYVDDLVSDLTIPVIKRIETDITIPEIPVGERVSFTLSPTKITPLLGTPPSGKQWKLMAHSIFAGINNASQMNLTYVSGRQVESEIFDYTPGGWASLPEATNVIPATNTKIIAYYMLESI